MGEHGGPGVLPVDPKCSDVAWVLLQASYSLFPDHVPITSAGECGHLWVDLVTEGGFGH